MIMLIPIFIDLPYFWSVIEELHAVEDVVTVKLRQLILK